MLKKGAAILLLMITLYNICGYLLAFQIFIYRSNKVTEQQISRNQYNPADLVEIKIPVHLPGIDGWRGYQDISGTVELAKGTYNYVRMKMATDTIYVMCVPNYKTTRLIKANVICAKEVSDAPMDAKKQTAPAKSLNMLTHFVALRPVITAPEFDIVSQNKLLADDATLPGIAETAVQPPEAKLS